MPSSRLPRKLAAVLYADVAGYSRLTADNEDETHRRLGQELDRIAAIVAHHRGAVMHYAGDAVLAKFDAVVDALACAVEVQRTVSARNGGLPSDRRLEFRIGVNLGDVIEDRGDVYGDGVNVAARVQTIAGAGEICVSESVYTAAGKKLPLVFEDLGPQTLKNIEKPVRVYRVLAAGDWNPAEDSTEVEATRQPSARGSVRVFATYGAAAILAVGFAVAIVGYFNVDPVTTSLDAAQPSIAVLPFLNLSSDAEQEYFADGLSEELLNSLAAIDGLRVAARTSSFAYKGTNEDLRTIAQTLGVEHVLEGSVRSDGDRLRITARLIDVNNDDQLWSEIYERPRTAVFAIQEEIAEGVAQGLQITLGVGKIGHRAGMTRNVDAYDEYLLAHAERDILSRDTVAHLERAVAIDPSFALALAQLATRYVGYAPAVDIPREEWSAKSAHALARARSLAPDATEVLAAGAYIAMERGEFLEAGRIWAQLNARGDASGGLYAGFLLNTGRLAAAIDEWERARANDPLNAEHPSSLARVYTGAGKFREANAVLDRAIGLGVDGMLGRLRIALGTRDRSLMDRALVPIFEAEARGAADPRRENAVHAAMGRLLDDPDAARAVLASIAADPGNRSAYEVSMFAQWAVYYGDPALALEVLNKARASGSTWPAAMALWGPAMGEMRTLPGFKTLVTDLGLVSYWREIAWPDFCSPVGDDDFQCR